MRDETLARDRLLDWLHVKVHHRVVYVIAEAGYGKTTLLADFSRRTRLRTLWYRLDEEDRTWIGFLSHLVAAGCEQDPEFAPATRGLLREVATAAPALETVLDTFIREIQALNDGGAVLVLDDYHAVDDAPDVRLILKELLARAPERVTFVIASRRAPSLPVARLRGQGEVAELTTDDLRFNEAETEQLFRETYGRPLEPDVLNDLSRRTEGWAASLQLVQAAIRGRSASEIRSFVRSISGAEGDLYDYLAEEVIGTLPDDLQDFLPRVALLHDLDPRLMASVTGRSKEDATALIQAGERYGLVSRGHGGTRGRRGFHPLVREFLADRLRRELGAPAVSELHRRAARTKGVSWQVACFHYAEAGDERGVLETLEGSVKAVLGGGDFTLAAHYLRQHPAATRAAWAAMILSRAEIQAGQPIRGVQLAQDAYELSPSPLTAVNLGSVLTVTGDLRRASDLLGSVEAGRLDDVTSEIALALEELVRLSLDGHIPTFIEHMEGMAKRQEQSGMIHYVGISYLNGATALRAQGDAVRCLDFSTRAVDALTASSAASELVSARLVKDWALAHLARPVEMSDPLSATAQFSVDTRAEAVAEAATIAIWYGNAGDAARLLELVVPSELTRSDMVDLYHLACLELALRSGELEAASRLAPKLQLGDLSSEPAHQAHQLAVRSRWAIVTEHPRARAWLSDAREHAERQGAWFWHTYCQVLEAAVQPAGRDVHLPSATASDGAILSVLAEVVATLLASLSIEDLESVRREARRRPGRWRATLREVAADSRSESRWLAAEILDEIGEPEDVSVLRQLSRNSKAGSAHRLLGRGLARRLAPHVFVEDQGRLHLVIGKQRVDGTSLRRKVLALLAFLLTRPALAATRDEVLDALWPDLEPGVSVNSLNQTLYFLRRVFEPDYAEQTSPGFVHFDSNVMWLDTELVQSRSAMCWQLIRNIGSDPHPDDVLELSKRYRGRFALDFAYEEWAIPYRDALHAAYLHVIEAAVAFDTKNGHYARGIDLARAALEVDAEAEGLEVSLVRLYRMAGAHAAAAEQYEHYATVVREEFGVDPPALEAL